MQAIAEAGHSPNMRSYGSAARQIGAGQNDQGIDIQEFRSVAEHSNGQNGLMNRLAFEGAKLPDVTLSVTRQVVQKQAGADNANFIDYFGNVIPPSPLSPIKSISGKTPTKETVVTPRTQAQISIQNLRFQGQAGKKRSQKTLEMVPPARQVPSRNPQINQTFKMQNISQDFAHKPGQYTLQNPNRLQGYHISRPFQNEEKISSELSQETSQTIKDKSPFKAEAAQAALDELKDGQAQINMLDKQLTLNDQRIMNQMVLKQKQAILQRQNMVNQAISMNIHRKAGFRNRFHTNQTSVNHLGKNFAKRSLTSMNTPAEPVDLRFPLAGSSLAQQNDLLNAYSKNIQAFQKYEKKTKAVTTLENSEEMPAGEPDGPVKMNNIGVQPGKSFHPTKSSNDDEEYSDANDVVEEQEVKLAEDGNVHTQSGEIAEWGVGGNIAADNLDIDDNKRSRRRLITGNKMNQFPSTFGPSLSKSNSIQKIETMNNTEANLNKANELNNKKIAKGMTTQVTEGLGGTLMELEQELNTQQKNHHLHLILNPDENLDDAGNTLNHHLKAAYPHGEQYFGQDITMHGEVSINDTAGSLPYQLQMQTKHVDQANNKFGAKHFKNRQPYNTRVIEYAGLIQDNNTKDFVSSPRKSREINKRESTMIHLIPEGQSPLGQSSHLYRDDSNLTLVSRSSSQKKKGQKGKYRNAFKDKKGSLGTQYLDQSNYVDKKARSIHLNYQLKVQLSPNKHSFEILPKQLQIKQKQQQTIKVQTQHHIQILKPIKPQTFRYDEINEFKAQQAKIKKQSNLSQEGSGKAKNQGTDSPRPKARDAENLSNANVTLYNEREAPASKGNRGAMFAQKDKQSMNSLVNEEEFGKEANIPGLMSPNSLQAASPKQKKKDTQASKQFEMAQLSTKRKDDKEANDKAQANNTPTQQPSKTLRTPPRIVKKTSTKNDVTKNAQRGENKRASIDSIGVEDQSQKSQFKTESQKRRDNQYRKKIEKIDTLQLKQPIRTGSKASELPESGTPLVKGGAGSPKPKADKSSKKQDKPSVGYNSALQNYDSNHKAQTIPRRSRLSDQYASRNRDNHHSSNLASYSKRMSSQPSGQSQKDEQEDAIQKNASGQFVVSQDLDPGLDQTSRLDEQVQRANKAANNYLEKQILRQRQLKERYQSSLSKYTSSPQNKESIADGNLLINKTSKKRLRHYKPRLQIDQPQDVYLPQNLDKITYKHQHSSGHRMQSFEKNTMKNSTKIQFKREELEIMVGNTKKGVLSFPQTTKGNPFSKSKQMQSSVFVGVRPGYGYAEDGSPLSMYPEIRSKSTLAAKPMTITGMTLRLPADQRDRAGEKGPTDRRLIPHEHSSLHASNAYEEQLIQNLYHSQVDYGNQYFNPHTTDGTFIAADGIDEEHHSPREAGQDMRLIDQSSKMLYLQRQGYFSPQSNKNATSIMNQMGAHDRITAETAGFQLPLIHQINSIRPTNDDMLRRLANQDLKFNTPSIYQKIEDLRNQERGQMEPLKSAAYGVFRDGSASVPMYGAAQRGDVSLSGYSSAERRRQAIQEDGMASPSLSSPIASDLKDRSPGAYAAAKQRVALKKDKERLEIKNNLNLDLKVHQKTSQITSNEEIKSGLSPDREMRRNAEQMQHGAGIPYQTYKDRGRTLSQYPGGQNVSIHQILNNKGQQNAGVMLAQASSNSQIRVGISIKPKNGAAKKVVRSLLSSSNLSPTARKRDPATQTSKMNETNHLLMESKMNYQIREDSSASRLAGFSGFAGVAASAHQSYQANYTQIQHELKQANHEQLVQKDVEQFKNNKLLF